MKRRIAVITGAGRGIGRACAERFAEGGCDVAMVSRSREELERTAEDIRSRFGVRTLAFVGDLSEVSTAAAFFRAIDEALGRPYYMVNNASGVYVAPFEKQSVAEWDALMAVNVRAYFLCGQQAFQRMEQTGGVIVNIGSVSGIRGIPKFPGLSAYVTSKYAVMGLTESMALEGWARGIRVHCLAPGSVETQLLRGVAPEAETNLKPRDIAETVWRVCAEDQRHLTNTVTEIFSHP